MVMNKRVPLIVDDRWPVSGQCEWAGWLVPLCFFSLSILLYLLLVRGGKGQGKGLEAVRQSGSEAVKHSVTELTITKGPLTATNTATSVATAEQSTKAKQSETRKASAETSLTGR